LTFVLILSSFSFTIKNIMTSMGIPLDTETIGAFLSSTWTVRIITIAIDLIVLFLLYYRVPQIHVKAKSAIIGAGITTILAQAVTIGFSAYMVAGIQRYEIIYGSLGKIIALLAWAYFSGYIILFGAHLTSSIERNGR
jgi:membrane protein